MNHRYFLVNDKDNIIEGMTAGSDMQKDNGIYYRLIALWVVCEAFAGGMLHAIKLPFTGMIISSLAVMCIVLIAWYVPQKGAILKATLIVAAFKLLLSPQSPPPAYIAVLFQGLMGQLLFFNRRFFKLSAILLAILSLVESAIQRILILLIMGNDFWKAVNQFIQKITNQKTITNYSLIIAVGYILLHAVVGLVIGIYFAALVKRSQYFQITHPEFIIKLSEEKIAEMAKPKKKKKTRILLIVLWLILLALFVQASLDPGKSFITVNEITGLIIRFMLILAAWYLFLSPLVMILIKKILAGERVKKKEMSKVVDILPQTKYIFIGSWQLSAKESGYNRLRLFFKILLINVLIEKEVNSK